MEIEFTTLTPNQSRYDDTGSESPAGYASGASPLNPKLARAASLTLHRVSYFGGELTIIATSHKVRRIKSNPNDRNA